MSTPLRFCIVSTFYPPYNFGGDGIYAHRLANALGSRGHEVTVLHSPSAYEMLAGAPPSGDYKDHPNVRVEPIRTPLGRLGLFAVQQTGRPCFQAPALKKLLHDPGYDVIQYNNVSLLGGPHVFRYGSGLKLCTLIEHWLVCPMHVLWKMRREVCTKPECLRCTIDGRRPPQLWRYVGLMRRATRSIDAFVGPSRFTIRQHLDRGIEGTMVQLPLFQAPPPPARAAPDLGGGGRRYFLFVGRLEKIKGVQTIIPLFRKLTDVDLLIAGSGDYEPELRRLAHGAENIKFLGRVGHDELHFLYEEAIATVIPSICYETFGVVAAESFCAGTPVVVYAQSSLEEIVQTHGGGITYRTPSELQDALRRLCTDAPLRQRLGEEGKTAYDNEFSQDPFMRNYLRVVRELIARKAGGENISGAGKQGAIAGVPTFFSD